MNAKTINEPYRYIGEITKSLNDSDTEQPTTQKVVQENIMADGVTDPTAAMLMGALTRGGGNDGLLGGSGGGLGLIALLALLGRNGNGGLFGGNGDGNGAGAVNQITLGQIQGTLGDIKASVPLAESQVQLALAGSTADINKNTMDGTMMLSKSITDSVAASLASQATIKEAVLTSSAASLAATMNAKFELSNIIRDDGDKTRAMLVSQNEASLQRQLTVAETALAEVRAESRANAVEVSVTQNVNQQQFQQQQQQQMTLVTNALAALAAQVNRGQQDIINLGTMVGNTQSSAQTNVR